MSFRSAITGRFVKAKTAVRWPGRTVKEGSKYPYRDGTVIVLGPGVFVSEDKQTINWNGTNYYVRPEDRMT